MKIICLNNISKVGLKALPTTYELTTELKEADAVLVRSANMLEMTLPEQVKAVARAGAGVNNIPLENYAKAGVVVFNTPGANANAVKELTVAAMLLASRDIYGGMKWIEANKADSDIAKSVEKAKAAYAGTEIMGKTLGVIGLGAVGASIAGAGGGLGMNVIGYEASPDGVAPQNRHKLPNNMVMAATVEEVYEEADFISLNVPLLPATKGMINRDSIAMMKDGVVILNLARDAIVNDADMKEALLSHKVRKYVTDFPNPATVNMEGVIAIPHLGASTEEAEDNCAFMAANQIVDFLENGNITNSVNYPNICSGPFLEGHRLVILHENRDGLGNDIVKAVTARRQVTQSVSKARGAYGATIVDFNHDEFPVEHGRCMAEEVAEMPGVIRVRVLKN
ncbi:MAG: 3-phosphoglycerate dehydrogenase [Bacilli bacterium]|jgi:D-3-phosphoglycerate dehydrogenase